MVLSMKSWSSITIASSLSCDPSCDCGYQPMIQDRNEGSQCGGWRGEGETLETSCYTYSIVDVGAATDHGAIVNNTHFAVHVQLLLDEVALLGLWVTLPLLVGHLTAVQHGTVRHGVLAVEAILGLALFGLL